MRGRRPGRRPDSCSPGRGVPRLGEWAGPRSERVKILPSEPEQVYRGSVTSPRPESDSAFGYAIAVIGPIAVAGALVSVRDDLNNANVALILVVVVVLAAVTGGRGAGVVAAVVSAMSFDFFHTRPYLSLTIDSRDDIETTIILVVIGVIAGELAVRARRGRHAATKGSDEIRALHRVAEQAASGAPVDELVSDVCAELVRLLTLERCEFETAPYGPPMPRLERNGVVVSDRYRLVAGEFALPEEGVELPVMGRGRQVGRLVMYPRADAGASLEERMVAVALSDQLGAALAAADRA